MSKTKLNEDVTKFSSVRIEDGMYKGYKAEVKHVYKDVLFLFSQSVYQNGGIIVEKTKNCILISS